MVYQQSGAAAKEQQPLFDTSPLLLGALNQTLHAPSHKLGAHWAGAVCVCVCVHVPGNSSWQ